MDTPRMLMTVPASIKTLEGWNDETNEPVYAFYPSDEKPQVFRVGWKGVYGTEVYEVYADNAEESGTVTMRYHPAVKPDGLICIYEPDGSVSEYEIIGTPDNISRAGQWLQMKVRRRVNG